MYNKLMENCSWLKQKGYYFIGDSAYALRSFLITPFDQCMHITPEDNYNFSILHIGFLLSVNLVKLILGGESYGYH